MPTNQPSLRQYPAIYLWPDEAGDSPESRMRFLESHKNADFITVNTESYEIKAEYIYVRY
jgi:hypothetical protein